MRRGSSFSQPKKLLETHNQLEALSASIRALDGLQEIESKDPKTIKTMQSIIEEVREKNRLEGHSNAVLNLSFNQGENTLASSGTDGKIIYWGLDGHLIKSFPSQQRITWSIEFHPKSNFLASGGEDGNIKFWNLKGDFVSKIKTNQGAIYGISFSPDGQFIASAGKDGIIKLWSVDNLIKQQNQQPIKTLKDYNSSQPILRLTFSPDSKMIAFVQNLDSKIRVWKLSEETSTVIGSHAQKAGFVKFSPNLSSNLLVSASYFGEIKLWYLKGKVTSKTILSQIQDLSGMDVSSDGKKIVVTGDNLIKIFAASGEIVDNFPNANRGRENAIHFYPNGDLIASAVDDKNIHIWTTGQIRREKSDIKALLFHSCEFLKDYVQQSKSSLTIDLVKICKPHLSQQN